MAGKQSLIEAYLKNLDKKMAAAKLTDYASAGQSRIKNAAAIQGTKSYMPTLAAGTASVSAQPASAEPLYFEPVEKQAEENTVVQPEPTAFMKAVSEPAREGRGVRTEEYARQAMKGNAAKGSAIDTIVPEREGRGVRNEQYFVQALKQREKESQPAVQPVYRPSAEILVDLEAAQAAADTAQKKAQAAPYFGMARVPRTVAAGQPVNFDTGDARALQQEVEALETEYYYAKNAEAFAALTDEERELLLRAAEETQKAKDSRVQQVINNAAAGLYDQAPDLTLHTTPITDRLRNTLKTEDFDGLLEYAIRLYNGEQQALRSTAAQAWAKDNPTGAFFAQAAVNLGAPLANLDVLANRVKNFGADSTEYTPLDTSSPLWSASHATQDLISGGVAGVEERNSGKWLGESAGILGGQEVGSWLYQTGASGLSNIVNMGVSALVTGGLGLTGQTAAKAMSTVTGAAMGSQAVANSILANKEAGMSDSEAVSLGIMSGVIEAVTEKIGLDTLLSADGTAIAKAMQKLIKNPAANSVLKGMIAEGGEELASNYLNRIADALVRGDENAVKQMYELELQRTGDPNKAFMNTVLALAGEDASAFLGGSLMGGLMGGAQAGANAVMRNAADKQNAASAPQMAVNEAVNAEVPDVGETAEGAKNAAPVADFETETGETEAAANVAAYVQDTQSAKAAHDAAPNAKKRRLAPLDIGTTDAKLDEAIYALTGQKASGVPVQLDQNTVERALASGAQAEEIAEAAAILSDFDEAYLLTDTSSKFRGKDAKSAPQIALVKNGKNGAAAVTLALDTRNDRYAVAAVTQNADELNLVKAWDGNIDMQPSAYAVSNADPESVSVKKAAYQYTEAESKQKSTAEVLEDLTDKELAELDTAYPQQADTHQRISVKQNDEIARQRVEIDMSGEKEDLAKKDSWNAEDVAIAQAILVKQRDMWRSAPEGDARQNARDSFNAWYDVVLEHKTTTAQALRQMQEYVTKMAADDPVIARMVIEKELAKVNAKGKAEFGKDKWTPFVLTEEENSRIESLVPGDEASLENIIADIGRRIQREYPSTFREKINEFTHVNMLLNSRTLLRNPLANVFLQGVSRASSKVSALTQAAIHAFDKDFKPTQALSVSKQSKELAKSVWERVGEDIAEQGQRYDKNKTEKSGYKLLPYANKKEVFKPRKQLPMLGKLAETASENLNKLSTRFVGAELFSEMSEEKSALENVRQLTYGLLELGDRGFVRASFVNRLASYIEARGITEAKDIPDEAFRLALEASLMDTFKDDNRVSNMMVGIKRALNEVGAGELLMPFVKTPANVTMRTIEYSPVGALVNIVKASVEGRKINAAKKNGGIYNAEQLSRTLDMAAKGLTGSALMATGALLAHLGVITGGVPDDEDEAAFLEQAGWKPFSFVTPNGKYISFDWAQPAAMPLILGASAYENTGKDGQGFLDIMTDFAVTYFDTIFEQSTLQEFENLFGGYGSTGDNIVDIVMNYPLRFVSSGVYAATKATDNIVRETYEKGGFSSSAKTLINKMYAKIPGLSKTLPAKYDIWGQIVKRDETYGEAFFNAYFNPGTVTSYKQTDENDEVLRLYDSTKNAAVFPMKPDRSVELDVNNSRQKIDCTNEQYSELCKETGLAAKSLMDAAMKSGYYKNLSDDDKVAFLAKMWSLSKVAGKVAVFEKDGAIVPGAVNNRAWSVYERDGAAGVIRYYSMKQDADTNASDDVSKGEVLIYLDGKNWSSQEKGNWLSTFVTSPKSDVQQVVNQYGESALASWYDYYSVLYNDALAYKEKQGNENVSLGTSRQRQLARETLAGMKIPDEQKAYYWDLITKDTAWQKRNPFD